MIDRPKFTEFTYKWLDNHLGDHRSTLRYDTMELKMDGIWGCMNINESGEYQIFSRTGKIKKEGNFTSGGAYAWPLHDTILLGEFIKGSQWGHKMGLDGDFYVFDCLKYNFIDMSMSALKVRRFAIKEIVDAIEKGSREIDPRYGTRKSPWVIKLSSYKINRFRDMWKHFVCDNGYEGMVLKDSTAAYGESGAWARVKAASEIEYMCIGFADADSESRYAGQVGAVIGSLIDKPCEVKCSGLTDKERKIYTDSPADYIGRVFTATGKGFFPSGSLRHPKFGKWRDDKRIAECTYDQIPEIIRED